jgi:hypothetical protein
MVFGLTADVSNAIKMPDRAKRLNSNEIAVNKG